MEIEIVTYQQVIDGYSPQGDEYGLARYALSEPRKTAFLSNPFLTDTSKVMLKLLRENGVIIGRSMMFPSRFKSGNDIIESMGGSALEVAETFRGGEAGGSLMAYNIRHKENNVIISSGFSAVAAKCHKALRAYMLSFPQLIQIHDYRIILLLAGFKQVTSTVFGAICNCLMRPLLSIVRYRASKINSQYEVLNVDHVPEWVNEISLNDGHQFMEIHDQKWFQWTLDNKFHDGLFNKTRFYTVAQNGENLGFFMIKERKTTIQKKVKKEVLTGTICEWGTKDQSRLSEFDLHLMALNYFNKNVEVIFAGTSNGEVETKLKKILFFRQNEAKIAFYDLRKAFPEAKDIKFWRVRYGYGDTILN